MKPAGTEFLFWIIFFSLTFGLWILYELRSWLRRQSRRNVLPPPRCDLVCRTGHDHWRVSDAKDLVIGGE